MGDSGIVGLVMQLGADTTDATAAIEQFAQRTGQSVGAVEAQVRSYQSAERAAYDEAVQRSRGVGEELDKGLLSNRESARLLSEELGIHLPRAVTGAIGEMLPQIASLGTVLLAAFAVEQVVKFGKEIYNASREASGMVEAEKLMADAVKENTQAMEDYAKSNSHAAEKVLGEMNAEIARWSVMLEARRAYFANENAVSYAMQFYLGEVGKTAEGEKKLAEMQAERDKIVNILREDEVREHKDAAAALKEHARAVDEAYRKELEESRKSLEETNRSTTLAATLYEQLYFAINEVDPAQQKFIHNEEQIAKVTDTGTRAILEEMNQVELGKAKVAELAKILEEMGKLKLKMPALPANFFGPLVDGTKKLTEAERAALPTETEINRARQELLRIDPQLTKEEAQATAQRMAADPAIRKQIDSLGQLKNAHIQLEKEMRKELGVGEEYVTFMDDWTDAAYKSNQAAMKDTVAVTEQFTVGLAALVGGRRAQAGIEAVWETARGIAMLAEGTWPPNPAALMAAGLHFEAAAQYAVMAGSGGGHRGGAGGSQSSYGRSGGDRGGGSSDSGSLPQTLAPGAGGAGGRFGSPGSGIVVVHGSVDLHQFVAGLVNGAVQRGITVTATSSQRGAPVGH